MTMGAVDCGPPRKRVEVPPDPNVRAPALYPTESDVRSIEETFRRDPVGLGAHPVESGQQPEASLASWRGDPPGEA